MRFYVASDGKNIEANWFAHEGIANNKWPSPKWQVIDATDLDDDEFDRLMITLIPQEEIARLNEVSNHPYECKCELCKEWGN